MTGQAAVDHLAELLHLEPLGTGGRGWRRRFREVSPTPTVDGRHIATAVQEGRLRKVGA